MMVGLEITDLESADAQKIKRRSCLANDWDMILSQRGFFSHGDSLIVLSPQSMDRILYPELVGKYQRVMFMGDLAFRNQFKSDLSGSGYFLSEDFTLIEGGQDRVVPLCRSVLLHFELSELLYLKVLGGPEKMGIAERLEQMQAASGLDSLPASFLVDRRLSRTVYLTTEAGDIAAVSTVADISSAGGQWEGTAMVLRTAVAAAYRRQGLGTYIKANAILQAHADFHSNCFIGIVSGDNPGSFRMNGAVGLEANNCAGLLGVEIRH